MRGIIVNCFDTYHERVSQVKRSLEENGYEVEVYTSDFKHIEKTQNTEQKEGYRMFHAEPYYKNISVARMRSHAQLGKDIFMAISKEINTVDLLWVLVPPNSFAKEAVEIKKKAPACKLVFDLIDLWPETMPLAKLKMTPPYKYWAKMRNQALQYADYIVCECHLYEQKLGRFLEACPHQAIYLARDVQAQIPKKHLNNDCYSLLYLGSMNNIIDIDTIGYIIRTLAQKKYVHMHLIGSGENKETLLATCKQAGAIVHDHGKVYDSIEKMKIMSRCHYGLNIMKKSVCVGLTMKSMDYMQAGLPMINNIKGDTWDLINKYQIGYNIDQLDSLVYDPMQVENTVKFFNDHLTYEHFSKQMHQVIAKISDRGVKND